MLVNLAGLTFETSSPSFYRLVHAEPDTADLSYLDGQEWALFHEAPNGVVRFNIYPSRDAAALALAVMAQARCYP